MLHRAAGTGRRDHAAGPVARLGKAGPATDSMTIPELVRLAKIRWRIEHDYRELTAPAQQDHTKIKTDLTELTGAGRRPVRRVISRRTRRGRGG
ncbi:hypothetical protein GCM10010377_43220 [Streptomyces viridiviolaceus]|nr:hypothetical protein GCM10010377_43220 [Streptomyces viridiviolaceus]